jgi:hypothetical protein
MPTSSNHTEISVHCCHGKAHGGEFANFIVRPRIHKIYKQYKTDATLGPHFQEETKIIDIRENPADNIKYILATDPGVPGSIPGAARFSNK